MTKDEIINRFKAGFRFIDDKDMAEYADEVLLNEKESKDNCALFQIYDANMFPAPYLSEMNPEYRKRFIEWGKRTFAEINIEVWFDDVKIRDFVKK